jgi:programmed cell death 6-interacting protein
MYAEANRQMSRDVVKALWEREWLSIVTGKQLAFTALAHFHKAQECNAKKVR